MKPTLVSVVTNWIATLAGSRELIGVVTGFLVGWGTSELTELRRRRIRRQAVRRAVAAELSQVEVVLSLLVMKCSYGRHDVERGVAEIRWLAEIGVQRARYSGAAPPTAEQKILLTQFAGREDDEVAAILRASPVMQENRALELHVPVVMAVLAAPDSGFNSEETEALGSVAWQAYMLSEEARWMAEFLRFSYTVSDPENRQIVMDNHARCKDGYRQRATMALDVVRVALSIVEGRHSS